MEFDIELRDESAEAGEEALTPEPTEAPESPEGGKEGRE